MDEVWEIISSMLLKTEIKEMKHRVDIFSAMIGEGEVSPVQLCKRYNCQSEGAANSNGMFPPE